VPAAAAVNRAFTDPREQQETQFFAAVEEIMALDSCACGRGPSGVLDGQFV